MDLEAFRKKKERSRDFVICLFRVGILPSLCIVRTNPFVPIKISTLSIRPPVAATILLTTEPGYYTFSQQSLAAGDYAVLASEVDLMSCI